MLFGQYTKMINAEEYYNELFSLTHEKEELLKRLRIINVKLIELEKATK